ncbi:MULTISPECIES: hypothetical protein [Comamonas]|uniref:hypothetical protein n=1 Tax=Comamonas TaxID=283 RepID=UPI00050F7920|nr:MULTISPECIES: hypothetical protein [Comamonas]KGG83439.1 hypothetical protein P369_23115 [Comamonas thiooxydans]KGG96136.1 hypothetical protein P367_19765 [Comamonas thiooxydans]KGH02570.1 hypothetical protein P365_18135 [Comamonas thiooxydans]KGH07601.1 hypothetical protein P368_20425 [Comamonas thiooxydans]TZG09458.1 hypothetical protein FZC30_12460 [Comamonas thiooxydans]
MTAARALPHAAAGHCRRDFLRARPRMGRWLLSGLVLCGLAACSSAPTNHGEVKGENFHSLELLQSDSNRMATLAMKENLESLFLIMDKLYRRNPAEWKKTASSREAAMTYVRIAVMERQPWHELQDKRDVAALSLALQPEFAGDRVAAFVHAAADMLITAHGGRTSFTLIDGLDPQHVFNAARNLEIANWILNSRKAPGGKPLLLSNQIAEEGRNLSFEREMGKIIGRLDLVADYTTERYRRSVIGYAQGLLAGPFMQFLPVR